MGELLTLHDLAEAGAIVAGAAIGADMRDDITAPAVTADMREIKAPSIAADMRPDIDQS